MTDDTCQCPKCGRMHRDLGFGKPPTSVMEQIARDMREGTFPKKSEQTRREEIMRRLLEHAGWDEGSTRHFRLVEALQAANLEIVERGPATSTVSSKD